LVVVSKRPSQAIFYLNFDGVLHHDEAYWKKGMDPLLMASRLWSVRRRRKTHAGVLSVCEPLAIKNKASELAGIAVFGLGRCDNAIHGDTVHRPLSLVCLFATRTFRIRWLGTG